MMHFCTKSALSLLTRLCTAELREYITFAIEYIKNCNLYEKIINHIRKYSYAFV